MGNQISNQISIWHNNYLFEALQFEFHRFEKKGLNEIIQLVILVQLKVYPIKNI